MRQATRYVILCAALVLSSPVIATAQAQAQLQEPDAQSPDIVVTGRIDRDKEVRDFVGALTPAPGGSIPRFIDAVCPQVTGLKPAQNEAVAKRLREVAAGAKIAVAPPGCTPNSFVIVTRDKRAFIDTLSARQPNAFGLMSAREVRRLARSPGPAAAWQLEGPVDSNGIPLRWDERYSAFVNPTSESSGRITILGGRGFDAAALVVEAGALDGLSATQLADYAAMRLLAKLDPARLPARAPATILTALTTPMGSAVPITMTRWDLGLLRGLYGSALDLNLSSQRSQIADQVTRDLDARERGRK